MCRHAQGTLLHEFHQQRLRKSHDPAADSNGLLLSLKKFCYLYIIPISYLLLPIYNKVLISTNLSTKSTYLSYTNNELLPLMDSPDTFFSKTQFKSIKYFNKS